MRKYILLIGLVVVVSGCRKKTVNNCSETPALYSLADYPMGVAVDVVDFKQNARYKEIVSYQFNSVTPENTLKFERVHPQQNTFYWADVMTLSDYCLSTNKRLHGHTLLWHNQLPSWVKQYNGSREDWKQLMKTHIQVLVSRLKGRVYAWDVVNEAFNEDGTLRNSIWREHIGDAYIELAFVYAHEADPDALLFYNDYRLEANNTKLKSVIGFLNNMRNRGIKVDGIGLQMHVDINYNDVSQIAGAIKEVYKNDYKVHLSELDISVNPLGKDIVLDAKLLERQADLLGGIVRAYNQIPAKYQYGITFWGVGDADSWIPAYFGREDYPLLYDENYYVKPAYCRLKETLAK